MAENTQPINKEVKYLGKDFASLRKIILLILQKYIFLIHIMTSMKHHLV